MVYSFSFAHRRTEKRQVCRGRWRQQREGGDETSKFSLA
jgi:hypothetical protein